jgi:hypothetical protein
MKFGVFMMLNRSHVNYPISQKFRKGAFAAAFLGLLVAACSPNEPRVVEPAADVTEETDEPIAQVEEEPITEDEENVTIDEVNNNLEDLIGETITVRSEIATTEDPNSFLLTDDGLFSGEDVLVINASGHSFLLPAAGEMEVQVTGEVRRFANDEVDNLGLPIVPAEYSAYEQQPVIFASSITLSPDPDDLVENPTEFYGEMLAVAGEVSGVVDTNTFTLSEPGLFEGASLLVLDADPDQVLEPGEAVVVTGELRPFVVPELEERDYDFTWDLDIQRELEAEYQEKPVFVAREVYPSAQ